MFPKIAIMNIERSTMYITLHLQQVSPDVEIYACGNVDRKYVLCCHSRIIHIHACLASHIFAISFHGIIIGLQKQNNKKRLLHF